MAVAAFVAHWFGERRRAGEAQHNWVAAEEKWNVGMGAFEDVRATSSRLLHAEFAVPFSDQRGAEIAYLNRTARLERRVAARVRDAMFDSREDFKKHEKWASQLRAERKQLETDLGVKADGEW